MNLSEGVLEAIRKDLPGATAGELKKFIEEAAVIKSQKDTLEKDLKSSKDTVGELLRHKADYENALAMKLRAETDLATVKEKEYNMALTIATEKIIQRDYVVKSFENFLSLLTKNPRAIELISETRNVPVFEQYSGGGGYHTTKPELTNGYRESTESKD